MTDFSFDSVMILAQGWSCTEESRPEVRLSLLTIINCTLKVECYFQEFEQCYFRHMLSSLMVVAVSEIVLQVYSEKHSPQK